MLRGIGRSLWLGSRLRMRFRHTIERRVAVCGTALLVGLLHPLSVCSQGPALSGFAEKVRRDTKWIAGVSDRSVGSPGHDEVARKLLERVEAVPNTRVWTQEFDVLMPITEEATVTIDAGPWQGSHDIYPVWPSLVRLNATPKRGISGKVIYVGSGRYEDMPARSLRGQIASMEMRSGASWKRAFAFGARAVLLLGSKHESQEDAFHQLTDQPVFFPRFYVPDGKLADGFRNGEVGGVKLACRAAWKNRRAKNIYCLLKADAGAEPQQALAMGAGIDAVSAVQGLAYGADAAVDAALVLAFLEEFAQGERRRPLLFVFADAQGINQLGVRYMLEALSSVPEDRVKIVWEDTKLVREYDEHKVLVDELGMGAQALEKINDIRYKRLHRYVKDVLSEELNYLDLVIPDLRLDIFETEPEERAEMQAELDKLLARQDERRSLQNQILFKTPFTDASRVEAIKVWQTVRDRISRQVSAVRRPLERYEAFDRLRGEVLAELGIEGRYELPILFLLGLDISDAGVACGPTLYCRHLYVRERAKRNATDFVRWLIRVRDRETGSLWPGGLRKHVNLAPLRPHEAVSTYIVGNVPTFTSPAASFGTKAASWGTLEAPRGKVDTARDRFDLLDWSRLGPQIDATKLMVERLVQPGELKVRERRAFRSWCRVWGVIVDKSPGDPVPKVPMQGYVTGLIRGENARHIGTSCTSGIRNTEIKVTGVDGRFRFDAVPTNIGDESWIGGQVRGVTVESFKLGPEGQVIRAVSKVKRASGLNQAISLSGNPPEMRAMVFDCVEVTSPPFFFDVRKLAALANGTLFDAVRRRTPLMFNLSQTRGQMCAFVPPDTRWQMLARSGKTGARVMLLNTVDPDTAESEDIREDTIGYSPNEPLPSLPEHLSAIDFWRINERRLRGFRRAGINNEIIERIHARTALFLAEAEAALDADDGAELHRKASAALANEMRAYKGVRQTADDVVRAVMFLLLGLLPFSIAMERLLFASPHIYKQITGTAAVFLVMCAALWSFHPAFRITNQPLMLVLAFLIIFLSTMVISILIRRFESDLEKIRSGRAEESGASTARGGLVSCALTIGIATMRKRKLRTALTGTTVALITFALLSFSSATNVKEYSKYELSSRPTYTGILVQEPNKTQLSGYALEFIQNAAGTNALVVPRYWWAQAKDDQKWRLHVVARKSGKEKMLKGGLVLSAQESEFTGVGSLLPDWERFMGSRGCYLAPQTAEALGVEPGDEMLIGGFPFTFTGSFDPTVFSEKLKTLTGEPLLPVDYTEIDADERQALARLKLAQAAESMSEQDSTIEKLLDYLDPAEMVVIPWTNNVSGLSMHSIAVRTESASEAERIAIELARRLDYPVYYSTGEGVNVLAAAALVPKAPRSTLIPLVVAGMIIFNTMLNSIAERKREIHIYTSLGLAPLHVGGIFLAEAITYGMMGGVFGYVIGQGLATLFSGLGWMGGLVLNYSGTQVMYTMMLVLAVVVISSLVPAGMAAKLASPSEGTNWKLPAPEDGKITTLLPFTVTHDTAPGILAFLFEYFDAHREGTIGSFSSDHMELLAPVEGARGHSGGLEATVWLAPYDLGVRQEILITVVPAGEDDICDLHLQLIHRSGQPKNWYRLNRVFVADLRSQLLGWRSVSTERIMEYIRTGDEQLAEELRRLT